MILRALSWRRIAATALALLIALALTALWLRWGETVFVRQLGALVC